MITDVRRMMTMTALALSATLSTAHAADLEVDVRDLTGKALQDAVVWIEPVAGGSPATQAPKAKIDQVNKEFVPLVSIVQTGTEVSFPNSDNIRHSIYSFSTPKPFTTKLYSGKQAPPVVFDKPGLVVLGCNIHDVMVAWLVVVDTPYFGKSGADGRTTIKAVDPGDYRLSVWYPTAQFMPQVEQVHIGNSAPEHRMVRIDSAGSPLPAVRERAGHSGP